MNENLIRSAATVLGSLIAYRLSKDNRKMERVPAMLIGGLIGTFIGTEITKNKKVCE